MPTDAEILMDFLAGEAIEVRAVMGDRGLVIFGESPNYLYRVVHRISSRVYYEGSNIVEALDAIMEQFKL